MIRHSVVVMVVACLWVAAAPARGEGPRLVIFDADHDFGPVDQGKLLSHKFLLRNAGDQSVEIGDVAFSMSGLTVKFNRTLAPNEEGVVIVEVKTDDLEGDFEGNVLLQTNDLLLPQLSLNLRGSVRPPIEMRPYGAVFLSLYHGESAQQSVTIVNHQTRLLNIIAATSHEEHFSTVIEPIVPGREYRLLVSVNPGVFPGRYRETLYLRTDDPEHAELGVRVNIIVKTDVYANPEEVNFGRLRIADLVASPQLIDYLTQTFLVKKRAGNLAINAVTTDVPFIKIAQDPTGPSQIHQFDIGIDREKLVAGPIDGTIRIATDDPRFPELVIPVRGIVE